MSDVLMEVKQNSLLFESRFRKIKALTGVEEIIEDQVEKLLGYLERLAFKKGLLKVLESQLRHHGLEKFFLGYNAYRLFKKKGGNQAHIEAICLGELMTMPIVFMDDIHDSHHTRNGKPTCYGCMKEEYGERGKDFTLSLANMMINHLLTELLSKRIESMLKEKLLATYFYCANRTYLGAFHEHDRIPRRFGDVLEIYKKKSHHFTTYFMSQWGALMGGGNIREGGSLDEVLLRITYLLSMKNDVRDIVGDGREALEDLLNYSNPLGLHILIRSVRPRHKLEGLLKGEDMNGAYRILQSDGSKKFVLGEAFRMRDFVKRSVKKSGMNYLNYLLYSDYMLNKLFGVQKL
jgi:geranylgeranyl pyrophosphate synthase